MSIRIEALIESDLQTILAEYDRDRSVPHPGTKGQSREDLLIRFLQKRLPTRFGIDSGHLINADGVWSKQQDIMIYDRFECPLFEDLGQQKVILVESVFATIEVKSTLTRDDLQDICEKAANTRSMATSRRFLAQQQNLADSLTILTLGFAFDSALKIEQINDYLRNQTSGMGVDILCVLRDPQLKAGFFLTPQSHKMFLLSDSKGESGNSALRRFLFEILLHLQVSTRLSLQADLSAYLHVFGMDKMVRLQFLVTRLFHGIELNSQEITEMLYLMGEVPGLQQNLIQGNDSVFMFERERFPNGTINAEVWMYQTADGTKKPIYSKGAWEAAKRNIMREKPLEEDEAVMAAVVQWYRKMRERNEKLVIQSEPNLSDRIKFP